jgi:hypothetical protein
MKFGCCAIEWDTEGEEVNLPQYAIVEADNEDEVASQLSDRFGWCIKSLKVVTHK